MTTSTCFELLLVQKADWIAVMSSGASALNEWLLNLCSVILLDYTAVGATFSDCIYCFLMNIL